MAMSNNAVGITLRVPAHHDAISVEVTVVDGVVNLAFTSRRLLTDDGYVDTPFRLTVGGPSGRPGIIDGPAVVDRAPIGITSSPRVCAKIMPNDGSLERHRLGGPRNWCGRPRGHNGPCGDWVYGSQPDHFEAGL